MPNSPQIINNTNHTSDLDDINDTNENDTLAKYLSSLVSNAKPVQEFVDINIISVPKSTAEVSERIKYNFEKYKGNYIILCVFFSVVFVVFNPASLPLIFVWVLFFTLFKQNDHILIKNTNIKKEMILKILGCISILYVLFVYYIVFALLATVSFFVLLVLLHMNLFYEKEEEEI